MNLFQPGSTVQFILAAVYSCAAFSYRKTIESRQYVTSITWGMRFRATFAVWGTAEALPLLWGTPPEAPNRGSTAPAVMAGPSIAHTDLTVAHKRRL